MLMYAVSTLLVLSIGLTIMGYAFKKTFLKIASLPFWLGLGVYIAYNFDWFGVGQWAFTLIGFLVGIPILLDALHKETVSVAQDDNIKDEVDEENEKEYKEYRKKSSAPKKRSREFDRLR